MLEVEIEKFRLGPVPGGGAGVDVPAVGATPSRPKFAPRYPIGGTAQLLRITASNWPGVTPKYSG